jgi:hypothetical protein
VASEVVVYPLEKGSWVRSGRSLGLGFLFGLLLLLLLT